MNLYPLSKLSIDAETLLWINLEEEGDIQPLLTIGRALTFKTKTEDATIWNFISEPTSVTKQAHQILDRTLKERENEELIEESLVSNIELIPVIDNSKSVSVEVDLGKTLNINPNLKANELECLITLLKHHKGDTYMRGIPLELCTHHIYIKNDSKFIHKL